MVNRVPIIIVLFALAAVFAASASRTSIKVSSSPLKVSRLTRKASINCLPVPASIRAVTSAITVVTLFISRRASISGLAASSTHLSASVCTLLISPAVTPLLFAPWLIFFSSSRWFVNDFWPLRKGSRDPSCPVNKNPRCPVSILTKSIVVFKRRYLPARLPAALNLASIVARVTCPS